MTAVLHAARWALRTGLLLAAIFVLVIVLSHVTLVAARDGALHLGLPEILSRAAIGIQDYFSSLLAWDLAESASTGFLPGQRRGVGEVLLAAYPRSLVLTSVALVLATALGLVVGLLAGATRSPRARAAVLSSTVLAISLPSFLLALIAVVALASVATRTGQRILPSFGYGLDEHLILPALVLGAAPFARIANVAFVALDEVLRQEYVRTARAKGLFETAIVLRHALANAAAPILAAVAASASIALSTLPVVETFFSWNGLGFALLQATRRFDPSTAGTLLGVLAITLGVLRLGLDALARGVSKTGA